MVSASRGPFGSRQRAVDEIEKGILVRSRVVANRFVCRAIIAVVLKPDQVVEGHVIQVELEIGAESEYVNGYAKADRRSVKRRVERARRIHMARDLHQHLQLFRAHQERIRDVIVGRPLVSGDKP